DRLIPRPALAGRRHRPVRVVARIIDQRADRLVGRRRLPVPVTDVGVIAPPIVQQTEGEVIRASLSELTGLIAVIAGEIPDGAETARGIPAHAVAEPLAEALVHTLRAIHTREVRAVGL